MEILIENAIKLSEEKEIKGAVISIGRLMKSFYQTWNKEEISDQLIMKTIERLSNNHLKMNFKVLVGHIIQVKKDHGQRVAMHIYY